MAMKGLQRNFGLSYDDPVSDASSKCKDDLKESHPICVWLRTHKHMANVFTPDWNNFIMKYFESLTARYYLLFTSSHPVMVDLCTNVFHPELNYKDYIEEIVILRVIRKGFGDKVIDKMSKSGSKFEQTLWQKLRENVEKHYKQLLHEVIEPNYYRYKCVWSTSDDIYAMNPKTVNYCSVVSYMLEKGFPTLTSQSQATTLTNYVDVLAVMFKQGYDTNRDYILRFLSTLGPNSELAKEFKGLTYHEEDTAYFYILSRLIPLNEKIERFIHSAESPHEENRAAAMEFTFSVLGSVYYSERNAILTKHAQLTSNMFRTGKTEELMEYTKYLPTRNQILMCDTSICPMIEDYLDSLQDYYNEATNRHVAIVHTDVDYPVFLNQKAIEEILHISQEGAISLIEIAKYLIEEYNKALDERFNQLKEYFQTTAEFSMKKAEADMSYIRQSLDDFRESAGILGKKVENQVSEIVHTTFKCLSLEVVEKALKAYFAVAEACNPFKTVFNGGTATDIMDAAAEFADSVVNAMTAASLRRAMTTLHSKLYVVAAGFDKNNNFLLFLKDLVETVNTNIDPDKFEEMKEYFFERYSAYTPGVTRPQLTEMSAYWETVVDEACDILDNADSSLASICKGPIAANGLCWNTKIAIQTMIETYSEIYEYQFDFIDTVANYMQALTAYVAAKQIGKNWNDLADADAGGYDLLTRLQVMAGISYISYKQKTWQIIEEYCDLLEYKEGGVRPSVCNGPNTHVAALTAYIPAKCNEIQDFFNIPMRFTDGIYKDVPHREFAGFLDLPELFKGNEVSFKVPNSTWLVDHNWIPAVAKGDALYITKFELYLPIETQTSTYVRVTAIPTTNNYLFPGVKPYPITPITNMVYEYKEGKQNTPCRQTPLLSNPYTICSSSKPPDLCVLTSDDTDKVFTRIPIHPSIYTLWKLKVHGYENIVPPTVATELNIKVGLTVCSLNPNSLEDVQANSTASTCCTNNTYWSAADYACISCPAGSTSALHGYHCEKNL